MILFIHEETETLTPLPKLVINLGNLTRIEAAHCKSGCSYGSASRSPFWQLGRDVSWWGQHNVSPIMPFKDELSVRIDPVSRDCKRSSLYICLLIHTSRSWLENNRCNRKLLSWAWSFMMWIVPRLRTISIKTVTKLGSRLSNCASITLFQSSLIFLPLS
jgi:hypothetical protein